ncbi:MAG: pyrimidine-nucleoside phosphorylase [Lachnospiraceae bacterium]|nr:pyrimidine-nucleoside phosphorylase [Lachnospiraceae bacterium]
MRMYDVIEKKRDGHKLSYEEIEFAVMGYTNGTIPDYQMSALLMAIYLKGMDEEETLNLTMIMANSGKTLNLSEIEGIKVDKHSTGGVGDKTSLVLGPMVAACGVPVAKMSGRGLGHTGGTIDKLESIEGFSTTISTTDFINNVNEIGIAIVGQTENLAPADKKIYALRDVTATVSCIPLIASSIMSKKLASGADCIVLDVKCGDGAFMKTKEDAICLANAMVKIGNGAGRKTVAIISDMDEPLGQAVGNSLEVIEAIDTLKGEGPNDLLELCLVLGSYMINLGGKSDTYEQGKKMLEEKIKTGQAFDKFKEFVSAQNGDSSYADNCEKFEKAGYIYEIKAEKDGYVSRICCEKIGKASLALGGGRENKESNIDLSVGIKIIKKVSDSIKKDDIIAIVYSNDEYKLKIATEIIRNAYEYSDIPVQKDKLIKAIITSEGIIEC